MPRFNTTGGASAAAFRAKGFRTAWPYMTAASQDGITMSASSETGGQPAYKSHRGAQGASLAGWFASAAGNGQWLKVRFEGLRRALTYSLDPYDGGSADTLSFDLQGSTDGTAWTTLDSASVSAFGGGVHITNKVIPSTIAYVYYRILVTDCVSGIGASGTARLGQWDMTFAPSF
jgi:hypothetical protein